MAGLLRITGMKSVLNKLKLSQTLTAKKAQIGLKDAGLYLQRKSQEVVPVDTSNLKGGAFTRNVGGSGFDTDMVVGYVADYAVYVHEDMNASHATGKKAKYLEGPAREEKSKIIKIIKGTF